MPQPIAEQHERVASAILDAAFRVHTKLGPGLLESVYEKCLAYELSRKGIGCQSQVSLPIEYDGMKIDAGLRLDLFVEHAIVVELKAVDRLLPVHEAQLLTYLKLTKSRLGFLLNFNTARLKDGIKRVVL